MTSKNDLEIAYNSLLAGNPPVNSASQANDAFEVYILSLVLTAAMEEGASIQYESSQNAISPSPLLFRTAPGRIFSPTHDYSHAHIQFPDGIHFEAHIGVYVEGLAGVLHECDVLVIDKSEGHFCRNNSVHPKKTNAVLTVECKFYAGNIGIALGRQFLGLTADLGKEGRFFITNSDGKSVNKILAYHKCHWFFGLTPLDIDTQTQVIAMFRKTFRDIKARRR